MSLERDPYRVRVTVFSDAFSRLPLDYNIDRQPCLPKPSSQALERSGRELWVESHEVDIWLTRPAAN